MTRDTYDITVRRASQLSHRLDLFKASQNIRRASTVTNARRSSFLPETENLRGSERTLFGSSIDSTSESVNSSRTNVHTSASCSYTNSRYDINFDDDDDDDDDDDGDDEDEGVGNDDDDEEDDDEDPSRGSKNRHEENEGDRGLWERTWHYIFLGFGVVFNFRNIVAFPSLILQHGGGAFLFSYVVLTYTVGIPLIYLEVSLGQYARGGLVKAWGVMPLAKGICISSLLVSIVSAAFTTTTPAAWALYYLYRAFVSQPYHDHMNSKPVNTTHSITTTSTHANHSSRDRTLFTNTTALQRLGESTTFFYHSTLELSSSISHFGNIVTHLVIALLIIWILVFIYASLGPRIMGKISLLFSATPSVLLLISTIGVCTLSGCVQGIRTFLNPHWQHLNQVETWLDSLELVLTGLTSGTGVMITLSGHCHFHGNTFRHAMLMTSMSVAMTVLCGCLMMASLGVQSKQSGVAIVNITQNSDLDLGFVLYPTVTSYLTARGFWNGTFYLAVVLLSICKASVLVHTIHQAFLDLARVEDICTRWRLGTLGALVVLFMSINLTTVAQNGMYILRLLQQSINCLATPTICVAQCVTIAWGYGSRRFSGRVSEMTGKNKSFIWKWLWRWGCPVILSLSVLVVLMKRKSIHYLPVADSEKSGLKEIYWILPLVVVLPGVLVSASGFFRVSGTIKQRLKRLVATPVPWGPGHPEHEPQADLPDYVICHPDPFRPANALAMLTANLYLPNIVNFVNMDKKPPKGADMNSGYLSDIGTMSSSDDEGSVDLPANKRGVFGRCWATLGCLGHVIGMGNIVRFPYLAYKHGGGAFLIAYLSLLVTCGLPLIVIEIAIGQFSSFGPINVWRAVPLFKGIGFCMVAISLVTSVYYGVVTSWAMYYLATTLTSVMPWQSCDNNWNTNSCVVIRHDVRECHPLFNITIPPSNTTSQPSTAASSSSSSSLPTTTTTAPPSTICDSTISPGCTTTPLSSSNLPCDGPITFYNTTGSDAASSSAAEYFYHAVTNVSSGLEETGHFRWQLILCLLMFWVVVGLCLAKGSKTRSKMTYLAVILPVSLLLILLIRCSALPGGKKGLRHLFTPDLRRLTAGHVWRDAASQVFFSLALGSGSIITSSTYNKFNSHIFREGVLVCLIDTCMSLLASLVMFAVIGAISFQTGQLLELAANADPSLAFVVLSHAVLQLPWSLFWGLLVFLSLVIAGVTTCSSAITAAMFAISERTSLRKQRMWVILAIVTGAFLTGILFTVQGGFYMVELFDLHLSGLPQLVVGGFTLVAFAWVYASSRLSADMARMTKAPIGLCWRPMWVAISPGFVAACIAVSFTSLLSHRDTPPHVPWWGTSLGMVLWLLLVSPIGVGVVHEMCVGKSGNFLVRLRRSCRPRKDWGATSSRYHSHIEYFPTVHTNIGIDLNVDGLNTIADHVEFTTVGVRVPSLSQTTLLPVSPKSPRNKRPMDMRHKAILNHAYSNPQCNTSSGSLEKIGKKKKRGSGLSLNVSTESMSNTFAMKKSRKKCTSCNASTQTEKRVVAANNKLLQRQRSQPFVWVSKPVRLLARSLSWHSDSMAGEPAILEVTDQQNSREEAEVRKRLVSSHESLSTTTCTTTDEHPQATPRPLSSLKEEQPGPQQPESEPEPPTRRRRRVGQSVAPNLGSLMTTPAINQTNLNTTTTPQTPLLRKPQNDYRNSRRRKSRINITYQAMDSICPKMSAKPKLIPEVKVKPPAAAKAKVKAPKAKPSSNFKEISSKEVRKHSKKTKKSNKKLDQCRVPSVEYADTLKPEDAHIPRFPDGTSLSSNLSLFHDPCTITANNYRAHQTTSDFAASQIPVICTSTYDTNNLNDRSSKNIYGQSVGNENSQEIGVHDGGVCKQFCGSKADKAMDKT